MPGDIEILPPAAQQGQGGGGELERLSASFTAAAEDVPATHTKVRLSARGEVVGTIELFMVGQGAERHLVVGGQEWLKPEFMLDVDSRAHFAAVCDRLLDEAVALAERLGVSLSTVTPGSLATADRLAVRGFRQAGDLWYRGRPGRRDVDVRFGAGVVS